MCMHKILYITVCCLIMYHTHRLVYISKKINKNSESVMRKPAPLEMIKTKNALVNRTYLTIFVSTLAIGVTAYQLCQRRKISAKHRMTPYI